ncbi:MAG: hypothetical protein Q8N53_17175 [Longimicrobiales bacterium]|nr:hypothetical protein [Longimicrobiales bacterium]
MPDARAAVGGVVIATPPGAAPEMVRACAELGIEVIVGGCPMMYCGKVDVAHRCMQWILEVRGRIEG